MRRSNALLVPLALTAALAGAGTVHAQEPFRFHKVLARGSILEIRGVIGDVVATPSDGTEVEVVARFSGNDGGVRVVAVEGAKGVTICALYPQRRNDDENTCSPGGSRGGSNSSNNDTHVDFEVRVPRGIILDANTVVGDVRATGMTAYVSGASVTGDVRITTTDAADASSVSGSVDVTMGRADWDGRLSFSSVSGSVQVRMPDDLNADVRASTVSGDIETDWPITVRNKFSSQSLSGTIGSGGRSLNLSTVSGNIRLLRRM